MKRLLLTLLGVGAACAACCAIPLALPLLGGLAVTGAVGWAAGWPLALAGAFAVAGLAVWRARRRRPACSVGPLADAPGACGCAPRRAQAAGGDAAATPPGAR